MRSVMAQQASGDVAEVIEKENVVEVAPGAATWAAANVGQQLKTYDKVRTGDDSRAAIRLSDATIQRVDELTTTAVRPPKGAEGKPTVAVEQGKTFFYSREKAREINVETPAANGAIRGTEFVVEVARGGHTKITMLDGELELSNSAGSISVHSGEEAQVSPGQRPTKTAALYAINSVQWCLYYPGVLDLKELGLSAAERHALSDSLVAYSDGDLLAALARFPRGYSGSAAATAYRAQLHLAVGQVDKARAELGRDGRGRAANALRNVIAAVTLQERANAAAPSSATEWIAESYYRQSKADLGGALTAAQEATTADPSFGFAWTRVAELQFSFGRIPQAQAALDHGLALSPRNPAAHSLRGYLYSAENKINDAKSAFELARSIDGALGDAWLGHGLCLIRQGHSQAGRQELQVASALEPNRSFFHSYVGKAFSNVGGETKARVEFERAKHLDPKDPTPWLYSAIENRQDSRINEAVRDLEESLMLNENRRVYRSQFLLDQDRAVRSANLAAIYQDDGMDDVAVREATRGVDADYSNASSHLFLANAYNQLRDPNRINLRYETPWFNELLLANLLAPVGGGPLSQFVSEQEYSKMFEADRLGISSTTTYFSTPDIRETASQFGIYGNVSYSLDTEFEYNKGFRPNNEITRSESYGQAKVQLSLQDSVFIQTKYQDNREGDLLQYYDQSQFGPGTHFRELQQPAIILLGYHHEWAPGIHTLLLAGRLEDEISYHDINRAENVDAFDAVVFGNQPQSGLLPHVSALPTFVRNARGDLLTTFFSPLDLFYHNRFVTYSGELNQIWETPSNTLIVGGRLQSGEFHTSDRLVNPPAFLDSFFSSPAAEHDFNTSLERETAYLYDTWRPLPHLSITGGVAFDRLEYPSNHRNAPISDMQSHKERWSPKAGIIWNPFGNFNVRAAYARSLGGVSFDESVSLEPNQVAGFNQVFRSIISESLEGAVAAPRYEIGGLLLEDKLPTGTYLGLQGTILREQVDRTIGDFDAVGEEIGDFLYVSRGITAGTTPEKLRYEEQGILASVNQLVGDEWSFGARYQLTYSNLQTTLPDVPRDVNSTLADSRQKGTLHQGQLFALYNHRSGFFGRVEGYWARQSNVGYFPDEPGDEIFQVNVYAGYRLRRNFGDVTVGLLDLNDTDYKLNPLNYYNDVPRRRTFAVRVRLNF